MFQDEIVLHFGNQSYPPFRAYEKLPSFIEAGQLKRAKLAKLTVGSNLVNFSGRR